MSQAPDIFNGTLSGTTDFVPSNGMKATQVAIHNRDTSLSFTISINDSNTWTLAPGEKLGLYFKNEVLKVTLSPLSGSPAYQLLLK